jgi:hypothetical protein
MLTTWVRDAAAALVGFISFLEPTIDQQPLIASKASGCVNDPQNRNCWKDGFDIKTDYEAFIPEGKLVEYHFTISEAEIAPDGYLTNVTLVNGQFPGPKIEADWGDTIRESF